MYSKIKRIVTLLLLAGLNFCSVAQNPYEWAINELSKTHKVRINNYDSVAAVSDSVLRILETEQDTCALIKAKGFHARHIGRLGDFSAAVELTIQGFNLYNKSNCSKLYLAYLYTSLGAIYADMDDLSKLDSVADLGLAAWESRFEDSSILSDLYFFKGNAQADINMAKVLYDSALRYTPHHNRHPMELSIWNNIGYLYAESGDYEKAKSYFLRCLDPARQLNDLEFLSVTFNNLAGLSDPGSTQLSYIDSALYYARQTGILSAVQTYTLNMGFALYNVAEFKKAYDYLYAAYELRDSLMNIETIEAIEEINTKYQSEKQANEIQVLKSEQLSAELNQLRLERNQVALIVGLIAFIILAVFFAQSFLNTRRIKNKLARKNTELVHERSVSDNLLLNILPSEVARELKAKGSSDARLYAEVTVLFTDFVSFTRIGENLSPTDLVAEVNRQFTYFDGIMEKYGLEKIKTIGDAYLAVCGLPDENKNHAAQVVKAAQEIIEFTNRPESKFKVRIGINSGPVVAGIVGVKKYAYDIWGDTVNTAARMEASSEPGKINITASTHDLISNEFTCTFRGKIDAKNKGKIDMYFVGDATV